MSPSENIYNIVYEYDQILIRDLGFSDWKYWSDMIRSICDILKVDSLRGYSIEEAHKNPGKEIVTALINSGLPTGNYWKNIVSIKESTVSTPYHDVKEYRIHVKTVSEFLEGITGMEVYKNYGEIEEIFSSDAYKNLLKLHGIKTIIS